MESKTSGKFFSSAVQVFALQILGVTFFYITSLSLSKNDFGVFSWSNAIALTIVTLLSCGLEQVVVRRVASSKASDWAAFAYFIHAVIATGVASGILSFLYFFSPKSVENLNILFPVFIAQGLLFVAVPLKQFLNAKERYRPYAVIAMVTNLGKVLAALYLLWHSLLSLKTVLTILIGFASVEFIALLLYILFFTELTFKVRLIAYQKLLREALPQFISIIFDASLGRLDWILLGILSTNIITADYSFAYRAFEVTKLPVFIIGPILFARFSRNMYNTNINEHTKQQIQGIIKIESFLSMLLPLTLCLLWSPVVQYITNGKYGASNETTFVLLSLCIPLHFLINLFWSICFTSRKYKYVSYITISTALANILLNIILIPFYGGQGAAVAFLIASSLQLFGYYIIVYRTIMPLSIKPLFIFSTFAATAFLAGDFITNHIIYRLVIVLFTYFMISVLSKQVRHREYKLLTSFIKK